MKIHIYLLMQHLFLPLVQAGYNARTSLASLISRICLPVLLSVLAACGSDATTDEEVIQATPAVFENATFAGRTANSNLFAAVITNADGVHAYFCDGQSGYWFRGAPSDGVLELQEASGATLQLELAGDLVFGRLTVGDTITPFELPSVQGNALFRADTSMGGVRLLGGWIKLPGGEQRGTIRAGNVTLPSTITADLQVNCPNGGCSAFLTSIAPAPFTPASALVTRNQPQTFTVIGLGDSFMAGEGAPVTLGDLPFRLGLSDTIPPFPVIVGFEESWSNGLPTGGPLRNFNLNAAEQSRLAREARACHRGASGLGLAVDAMRSTLPASIEIVHQNFACSGAKVANLIDEFSSGPAGCAAESGPIKANCLSVSDDLETAAIRPQFPEALDFLAAQRLKADAVVMSVGGNDLGFGDVLKDCIASDCAKSGSKAREAVDEGLELLPDRYRRLNDTFTRANLPPGNVFLTSHPSPLVRTAGDLCAGTDFGGDLVLAAISDEEALYATSVLRDINSQVSDAVELHLWKPVTSHLGTEVGHGICSTQPWYNSVKSASATQGADLPSYLPGLFLSAGMVHPNQAGQREAYMPAYRTVLDSALTTRFTPKPPRLFRAVAFRIEGSRRFVDLRWDDTNDFESKNVITNTFNNATVTTAPDVTRLTVELDGTRTVGQFALKTCFNGPREVCTAAGDFVEVEVKIPSHRPSITANGIDLKSIPIDAQPRFDPSQATAARISWSDAALSRLYSTVEVDNSGSISRHAVAGQSLVVPYKGDYQRFRVAACNTLGCGPVTDWTAIGRPPQPACVPPQRSLLDGCR